VLLVFFAGIREDKDVVNIGCAKYIIVVKIVAA
jgi:hypothetical protein